MALENNKNEPEKRRLLRDHILHVQPADFEPLALEVFRFQSQNNPIYKQYISNLRIDPNRIESLLKIPFLPIQFFKQHTIKTGRPSAATRIFQSSGTTGQVTSSHHLFDSDLYENVSEKIFQHTYGDLRDFHIFALLPSYLERTNSSLVYMMQHFIGRSASPYSGFYLHNTDDLLKNLRHISENPDGRKILLLGVTFALLDLAESAADISFLGQMQNLTVMDTGGMKGRRQELLREEVHDILIKSFGLRSIHSEYGMTELLSQGYSKANGLFEPGYTMRVLLRDINDPFQMITPEPGLAKTGGINVIDLANLDTCSFIETQDLGRYGENEGAFYVMGRFDNADVRGCNLMVL